MLYTHFSSLRDPLFLGSVVLALYGCNGRLAVMDESIGNGDSAGQNRGIAGAPDPGNGDAGVARISDTAHISRCNDGIQNGDETGLDCGGSCASCPTLCDCGSTNALQPLGCELTQGLGVDVHGYPTVPFLNAAGDRVAFSLCDRSGLCQIYYWSLTDGASAQPPVSGGTQLAGMNADASLILSSPNSGIGARALLGALGATPAPTDMLPSPVLMSSNGTVVGISSTTSSSSQLSRRSPNGDLEVLATLPVASKDVKLVATTADASTVVGQLDLVDVFRWTAVDGLVVGLSGLPDTEYGANVQAMSSDGKILAGYTSLDIGDFQHVYRWGVTEGYTAVAAAEFQYSSGTSPYRVALSDDGSVLGATFGPGNFAYGSVRWTPADGSVPLAPEASNIFSLMSADGSRLIIGDEDAKLQSAFLWTQSQGARNLRTVLESAGADFHGWQATLPVARSADGRVIVGTGTCGGVSTLYRAALPE